MSRWIACAVGTLLLVALGPAAGAGSSDQQIAEDSILTLDDVPTGFRLQPLSDEEPPPKGAVCKRVRRGRDALNDAANAESQFRTPGDDSGQAFINNKVAVFETVKPARSAYRDYASNSAEECFQTSYEQLFREQINAPNPQIDVSVERYQPDLGDASVGYEITIEASAQGESITYYVDVEVALVGRAVDAFAFLNANGPPPSDDVVAMTDTGIARLEQAL